MFNLTERNIDKPDDDPVEELFDAIDAVNVAWAKMPRKIRLWIDWQERRVVVQTYTLKVEELDPDGLRSILTK